MSFFFIANNIHFSLELIGALVFFVMAWLSVDAYVTSKHYSMLMRIIGFGSVSIWQIIHAFNFGGDFLNFFGFSVYIAGLALIVASYISTPKIATVSAVILIPAFIDTQDSLYALATILLGSISFYIYRQSKLEFNKSVQSLCFGFGFLTIASFFKIFHLYQLEGGIFWYTIHFFELLGFIYFIFWVWQYLKLRVRESLVLIFLSMTLFIATMVTLAFSTILITQIEHETRNNLIINTRVFDFSIQGLLAEAQSGAKLVSADPNIPALVSDQNLPGLQANLSTYLNSENLGFLLVTDRNGVVLMRAHSPRERGDVVANERTVEEALIGNNFSTIEFSPAEKFSIRASTPIYKDKKIIGVVVAGFPLDNVMVDKMKKITGLDTTIYQGDMVVSTTSLDQDGRNRLVGIKLEDQSIKDGILKNGNTLTSRVSLGGISFLASYLPIKNQDGEIVGMFSAAKPQADILDIANTTNRLTIITVTILLLILAFPIFKLTKYLVEGL